MKDNLPVTQYYLKDYKGESVPSNEYNTWVIKERKRGKQKEYLLKYQGWPDEYNEWVKGTQLKGLQGKYRLTK